MVFPELTPGALPPTSRLTSSHDQRVTPDHGTIELPTGAQVLAVGVEGSAVNTFAVYLDTLPPPGDHYILDLWDGVSLGWGDHHIFPVPDVDGDGIYDYWAFYKLLPGPIMGRDTVAAAYNDAPIAHLGPDKVRGPLGFGVVMLSNFDADGDGHIDILVDNGGANLYEVYFGPFSGEIVENVPQADKTNIGTGASSECNEPPILLPDLLGPGRDAIAVGGEDWPRWCPRDRFIFPLEVERTGWAVELGSLDFPAGHLQPVGDLDGNGTQDVMAFSWGLEPAAALWSEPFDEHTSFWELPLPPATTSAARGHLMGTIGDVNGDGIDDLLGYVNPYYLYGGTAFDDEPESYVLLSPFDDPIVIDAGIRVEPVAPEAGRAHIPWTHGDFDGDGHSDLIYMTGRGQDTYAPYVPLPLPVLNVYSGADLTAADPRTTTTGSSP
mgnify:FL=1